MAQSPPLRSTSPALPDEWTTSLAECVARVHGIDPLTELHWRVISECREEWASSGKVPELEQLSVRAHLSMDQIRALFPPGQLDLAWILSGVSAPASHAASSRLPLDGTLPSEQATQPLQQIVTAAPDASASQPQRFDSSISNPAEGASPSADNSIEPHRTTKEKS